MRGILVFCPSVSSSTAPAVIGRSPPASFAGFTLLELLVVLLLVALAAGMVAPAALRGLTAAQERAVAADLEALLAGLPAHAFRRGEALRLDAAALRERLPELPADWRLETEPALAYGPTGVALPARVSLHAPARAPLRWQIDSPTGDVRRLP
jgi:prepilin-type N-terminal cleavage/methylation domain-containing protein